MKKWVILVMILALVFVMFSININPNIDYIKLNNDAVTLSKYDEHSYSVVSSRWTNITDQPQIIVTADEMDSGAVSGSAYQYSGDILHMKENQIISFDVTIPQAGAYSIQLNQRDISTSILPNKISLAINNKFQYVESAVIELPTFWEFD